MSILTTEEITPHIANGVLNWFDQGGYPLGDHGKHVLRAASSADSEHKVALAKGYPGLVRAFLMGQNDYDGIDKLRAIAGGA